MFHIALFSPQIPPNTGNIIRLVANNGCKLHLIKPLGFSLDEKPLRRAGLDYHDLANINVHENFSDFLASLTDNRIFIVTTKGKSIYTDICYEDSDVFLFGSETSGIPLELMKEIDSKNWIKIPMKPNNRSLNLSNSVAIVSYEAWRQIEFS